MSKVYGFKEQLKIGKEGESKLDKFFLEKLNITIKQASMEQELTKGFDRIFTSKKNGKQFTIEYKYDEKATKTGNVFIETLSKSSTGKKGWVLTSQADFVAILVGSTIYVIRMNELREHIKTEGDKYRLAKCKNPTYYSEGRLMPIKELKKIESLLTYVIVD